ncbi:NfeD family protein [Anaeromicropila herbilytica]|uniref:Protease n=1 Tax=Anaeromicropila herbilytica TaxID=2785025 RepID=A0A7R7EIY3_9FIRM|nr:NfeD family protein [Anaeromicropila herbilytica]BCN29696.1 protease [Anaeromicropila herbilytica]
MESVYWLILLAALLVIEIITLGLTTIWFAIGAFFAFVGSLIGLSVFIQIVLFVVVSVLMLYFTRPVAVKFFNNRTVKTNYQSLIGKEARVLTRIDNFNATGSASLDGQEWTARAADDEKIIEAGVKVTVVDIVGVKLIVKEKREEM